MDRSTRFRINAPRVIHESFEQEIVIVNLDTGRYYCLQKTGVDLWNGLIAGAALHEIVAAFEAAYETTDASAEEAVWTAIAHLQREELIVESPAGADATHAWRLQPPAEKEPFDAPTLQTYTDMQDLLLLDPIHEVDDMGWPVAADPMKKGPANEKR